MLFDTKFDLVVSIGEDCACSSYLRRCKLQDFSYPFDWLTKAAFSTRINLILNNFADFLDKENMYQLEKPKTNDVDKNCDYWADKKYNFYFYHDFLAGVPFEEAYPKVKTKFARRIARLYKRINYSKNILFVWWSRNKHQDIELLKTYYKKLSQKFSSSSIYLLLIEFSEKEENIFLEDNHILVSRYDNISYKHNNEWNETLGNETNNLKLFKQIKMNRKLGWYIKYLVYHLFKILIELIPVKKVRKELRHNLKAIFYKEAL